MTNQEMHELEKMLCIRYCGYEYYRALVYRDTHIFDGVEIIHNAVLSYMVTREITGDWDEESIKKRWRIKGLRKDKEALKKHSAKELLRIISKYEFLKAKMGGWRCYDRCGFYAHKYDESQNEMPCSFKLILKRGTYVFSEENMEIEYWKSYPMSSEEIFKISLKDINTGERDNDTIGKGSEVIDDEDKGDSLLLEGALTSLRKCLEGLNELDEEDMHFIKVKLFSELDEWDIKWGTITNDIIRWRLHEQVETIYSTKKKQEVLFINLEAGNNVIVSGVKQKSADELITELEKRY